MTPTKSRPHPPTFLDFYRFIYRGNADGARRNWNYALTYLLIFVLACFFSLPLRAQQVPIGAHYAARADVARTSPTGGYNLAL